MKKVLLAGFMMMMVLFAYTQKWNPFVNRGLISPAPLLPHEFKGTGVLSFVVGNSGNNPMKLVTDQEMTLMITLSSGIPEGEDPLTALEGTWAGKFKWNYKDSIQTYIGIQKEDIPGNDEGTITIRYKVTFNSRKSNPSNGFNVNLQQPPYTNGINLTDDDAISAYTYVQAFDFGDAPLSYGYAVHEINLYNNPGTQNYENYVYLGHSVDPEPSNQPSPEADGDDLHLTDDEDGIVFPPLVKGDTVSVPVYITVNEGGFGMLNGWIDWNGDGDFTDSGEKVIGSLAIFKTGIKKLTIAVPSDAEIKRPVFARFRFGDNITSPGNSTGAWGEVEDYRVTIVEKRTP